MSVRRGLTLVEVIVVLTVIALLLTLLIPAIQRVREASLRTRSMNNLRQIGLATHSFGAARKNRLPSMDGNAQSPSSYPVLVTILPFLEQGGFDYMKHLAKTPMFLTLPMYISPADPSYDFEGPFKYYPLTSYIANAQVFHHSPNLQRTIPDGTSNTIAFAEHYAVCQGTLFSYEETTEKAGFSRRATFADGGRKLNPKGTSCNDFYPHPKKGPPVKIFQVAPPLNKCDPRLPQTPHPAGMLVSLADGSCRILAPDISNSTFWSAVTPAGGEVLRSDW